MYVTKNAKEVSMGLFSKKSGNIEDTIKQVDMSDVDDIDRKPTKLDEFKAKFKLGDHFKMERTMLMVGILTICLLFTTTLSFIDYSKLNTQMLSTRALYTKEFTFSKTDATGNVQQVFRSADGKKGFVLLKMQTMANMSTDAKTYEFFVTGFDKELTFKPSGSIFIFGSTGYMGIQIHDMDPIPSEIVSIIIRANKDVSGNTVADDGSGKDGIEASFTKFNQAQLYCNFGAEEAIVKESLNNELEPSAEYRDLVSTYEDEEIKATINDKIATIGGLLERSEEYLTRLDNAGYNKPALPVFMRNDEVINLTNAGASLSISEDGNVVEGDEEVVATENVAENGEVVDSEDVEEMSQAEVTPVPVAEDASDGHVSDKYELRTNYIMTGGVDLDYMNKTIYDGYLNQVVDDPKSGFSKLMADLADEATLGGRTSDENVMITELTRKDGTILELAKVGNEGSASPDIAAKDDVSALVTTWTEIRKLKRDIQVTEMKNLLTLDERTISQDQMYTTFGGEGAIYLY